jgi:hypothetical protein
MPFRFKIVRREKVWRSRMILFFGVLLFSTALIIGSIFVFPGFKTSFHGSAEEESVNGVENENPFSDVKSTDPGASSMMFLKRDGVISGYPDLTFKPEQKISRAQLVKMVVAAKRAEPHPLTNSYCFSDVQNQWHARYICFAESRGWVKGNGKGIFKPDDNITKVEAYTIVQSAFDLSEEEYPAGESFGDSDESTEITRAEACDILAKGMLRAGIN